MSLSVVFNARCPSPPTGLERAFLVPAAPYVLELQAMLLPDAVLRLAQHFVETAAATQADAQRAAAAVERGAATAERLEAEMADMKIMLAECVWLRRAVCWGCS